ncbi:unnamed protein product [Moneuplotes crassus]|uniref:Uncharacterized protein n=1 Tax=Euplotes crassus TaxID=5936 RepID=A0AAD1X4K4_EUPCR|nr:unnamed protein product [Moneuplotes crassus]
MLRESLKKYGQIDELDSLRNKIDQVEKSVNQKAFQSDVDEQMQKFRTDTNHSLSEKVNFVSMPGYFEKYDEGIKYNTKKFIDLDRKIKELKRVDDNLKVQIDEKLVKIEFTNFQKATQKKFEGCISFTHLEDHRDYVDPKVVSCCTKVSDFRKEIDEAKEIIKRFDEVICEKASKFSVDDITHRLKKFLTKEEVIKIEADYKRESDLLIQELKSMRKEYIEIKRGIIKENLSLLDKSSKDVEKRIINHLGGKPYSTYEIQEMLSHKADKTKMIFLDDLKADKVELENCKYVFSHNNSQMINLVAILIEYLQLTIPKSNIAENTSVSRKGNILKRMYNLFQNINKNEDVYNQRMGKISKTEDERLNLSQINEKNKTILNSMNDFIDVPIDTDCSLFNTRHLATDTYTPDLAYQISESRRRKAIGLKMKFDKLSKKAMKEFKRAKSRGLGKRVSKGRNFSALNKCIKQNRSTVLGSSIESGTFNWLSTKNKTHAL